MICASQYRAGMAGICSTIGSARRSSQVWV